MSNQTLFNAMRRVLGVAGILVVAMTGEWSAGATNVGHPTMAHSNGYTATTNTQAAIDVFDSVEGNVESCLDDQVFEYDTEHDRFPLIPFYTGRILPVPQKVDYHSDLYPLENTGIICGKNFKEEDPRLGLLLNRIARYGGHYEFVDSLNNDCETVFILGESRFGKDLLIPDEVQGYAVECYKQDGKNIVLFDGRDYAGVTWAINSLVQMICSRDDKTFLHAFEAYDFPFVIKRGVRGPGVNDYVLASKIYPLMTKLDWIIFNSSLLIPRRGGEADWRNWRKPRPEKLVSKLPAIGKHFGDAGIQWQITICPYRGSKDDKLKSKCDEDFYIIWRICEPILEARGGINFAMDDFRFPIHAEDKKHFGTAREADIFFVNRLYKKIKTNYPKASLSLIQPFYNGPKDRNPWFEVSDESPIDYLRAIGERLPEDIGICWSGLMCKSTFLKAVHVERMRQLIKRKPYFFQNSTDFYHIHRYVYPSDVLTWWLGNGREKDVYHEFDGVVFNSLGLYPDMLWSAMLWNPAGYNPEEAAYQATSKLVGPENYETIRKLVENIAYFDRYRGKANKLVTSVQAARNIDIVENRLTEAKKLLQEFEQNQPSAISRRWVNFKWVLGIIERTYERLKEDERYVLYRVAPSQKKRAEKEAGFAGDDILLAACDFKGGILEYTSTVLTDDKRLAHILSGHTAEATAEIEMPETIGKANLKLILSAKRYGAGEDNDLLDNLGSDDLQNDLVKKEDMSLAISFNDEKVFEGIVPYVSTDWKLHSFPLTGIKLKKANTLQIRIKKSDGSYSLKPLFCINYAVIKQPHERGTQNENSLLEK